MLRRALVTLVALLAVERGALAAKPISVGQEGKLLLPASGVYADIPKGWDVRVTDGGGGKVDVLERTEPPEPVLRVTVERRAGDCASVMPEGQSVLDAPYLPGGFGPASIETRDKALRTAMFCLSDGSDAILASVTYGGELTHPDVRVVKSILAPAAGGRSSVGTTVKTDADVDEREDEMEIGARIRGVVALDLLYFSPRTGSGRPGVGASIDAYSSTARHGLGFAVEVGGRGGVGTNGFLTWDAYGGVGGALAYGKFMALLTVGGGGDGFHPKDDGEFTARSAGYVYGAPRFIIPLARKVSLDVRGAYVHRFDDELGRELRGHLGVALGSLWVGVRATQYADRALLGALAAGLAF